jgi:hypothetical protein
VAAVVVAEEERVRASVLVAADRAECLVVAARARADLAPVGEGEQGHRVKPAAFGKAAVVQGPPEAG